MKDEKLELLFITSLISLIINEQEKKGRQLTLIELELLRDNATCIALPKSESKQIIESRGYRDINPENLWEEYLEYLTNDN